MSSDLQVLLRDHRVVGRSVLPGAAAIELAVAAARQAGREIHRLRRVQFVRPLAADGAQVDLRIRIDGDRFTLSSAAGDHVTIELHDSAEDAPALDLPAIRSRVGQSVSVDGLYASFANLGIEYGPALRAVRKLDCGDGEVLAVLDVPTVLRASAGSYTLHPSLIDAAMHCIGGLAFGRDDTELYLPLVIDEITVHAPVRGPVIAHGRLSEVSDGLIRADVTLAADDGAVCAQLLGVAFRRVPKLDTVRSAPRVPDISHRWIRRVAYEAAAAARPSNIHGTWWVVGRGARAVEVVKRLGATGANVTLLDPQVVRTDDLSTRPTPTGVLFLGLGSQDVADVDQLESAVDDSVRALVLLTQGLLARKAEIVLVCAYDRGDVFGAAASGIVASAGLESRKLHCRVIELDDLGVDAPVRLVAELAQGDLHVRLDATERRRPVLGTSRAAATDATPLQDGGTYLVTGGLGGIGLEVAKWLWTNHRANLVLTGRTAQTTPATEALRAAGAKILVEAADVSDPVQMRRVLERTRTELGPIVGAFHAAGVTRDGLLHSKSITTANDVLAPKIRGAWVLDQLLDDDALLVLFSSIVALKGNIGQADYTAANRYLDAFAENRHAAGRPTYSIGWGPFAEVGMAVHLAEYARRAGVEPMPTRPALVALQSALRTTASPHLIIADLRDEATKAPVADAPTTNAADTRQVEQMLTKALAAFLEIDEAHVDPDVHFADFGLDSILGAQLVKKLEAQTNIEIPPTVLFEHPTVAELAVFLGDALASGDLAPPVAATPVFESTPVTKPTPSIVQIPVRSPMLVTKAVGTSAATAPLAPRDTLAAARETPVAARETPLVASARDVAVVGYAVRLPGADDAESFWSMLLEQRTAVREIPSDRWSIDDYFDPDPDAPGKTHCKWGAFLEHIDAFDPLFFNITPREAAVMDPQQRLLLEVCSEATEHAGYGGDALRSSRTGVFVGGGAGEYGHRFLSDKGRIDALTGVGNSTSILANRISYTFDLRGPSLAIDTACSSSLVALHLAVESLAHGECDTAIAAGVNLLLGPDLFIAFSKGRLLSGDGACRPFDARANGYVRGEGAGAVLLKPLARAVADGDTVYGVIKGTATNQDGRTLGITAPNPQAQADVMTAAYAKSGVAPTTIDYVEAHATASVLSDRAELAALNQVIGANRNTHCALGSLKGNVGHLELASGIVALVKVLLAFAHETLPPTRGFEQPHPELDLGAFDVVKVARPWPGKTRRAAVSAFGFGGTNAHVVVEAPPPTVRDVDDERPHLLVLSGRTIEQIESNRRRLIDTLGSQLELRPADVCHTLAVGRPKRRHRLAIVGSTLESLRTQLSDAPIERAGRPKLAFVFAGQGAQYTQMGRALYDSEPRYRAAFDEAAHALSEHLDRPLASVVFGDDETLLAQTAYTQPALFAVEYGLTALWRSWGVTPDAVLGHSIGELAAACVAGVSSLDDTAALVAERGRVLQSLPAGGAMAVVLAAESAVAKLIAPHRAVLSIAAVNGAANVTISGARTAVDAAMVQFAREEIQSVRLNVSHAFHSPLVDPVVRPFELTAAGFDYAPPQVPFISTVTGARMTTFDGAYWARHLGATVRFSDGVEALRAEGCDLFLEIGPHATLTGLGRKMPFDDATWIASMVRRRSDQGSMLEAAAALFRRGVSVDPSAIEGGPDRRRVALPPTAYARRSVWVHDTPPDRAPVPVDAQLPHGALANGALPNGTLPNGTPSVAPAVSSVIPPTAPALRRARTEAVELITAAVAKQLGLSAADIDEHEPIQDLGIDSLMAVELLATINARLGTEVALDDLAEGASIFDLVNRADAAESDSSEVTTQPQLTATLTAIDPTQATAAYARFARPAVVEMLAAASLDKIYVWAEGDRMAYAGDDGQPVHVTDWLGGFGCTLFGHNHPEMIAALTGAFAQRIVTHAQASCRGYAGLLAAALAERLEAITGRTFITTLSSTGAEAVEAAIKHAEMAYVARVDRSLAAFTKKLALVAHEGTTLDAHERARLIAHNDAALARRPAFIALERSFHGKTSGAVRLTANPGYRTRFSSGGMQVIRLEPGDQNELLAGVEKQVEMIYDLDREGHVIQRPWCAIAAAFVEPVQGEGGVRPLDRVYLAELRALADQFDFPIVIDEIQSGFGRCGAFVASDKLGLRGDYYTLGKSLGGGVQKIGALLVDEASYEPDFALYHTSTFAEDDPSALVGLRALDVLARDGLAEAATSKGERLTAGLRRLATRYPTVIADVRGMGLLVGLELHDPARSASTFVRLCDDRLGYVAASFLLHERQIRVMPTASSTLTLRFEPSAYISDGDIDRCVDAVDHLCQVLEAGDTARLVRCFTGATPLAGEIRNWTSDRGHEPSEPVDGDRRVAFVTYFIEPDDIERWCPSVAELPLAAQIELVRRFHRIAPPKVSRSVRIRSVTGDHIHVDVIGLMITSELIEAAMRDGDLDWIRERLDEAVALAQDLGCEVVGLGGLLSVVSHNAKKVVTEALALTTGNALTVAMGVQAIHQSAAEMGLDLSQARTGIVGAAGNIGSTYVRIIAESAARLILVGRKGSRDRLVHLAHTLYEDAWRRITTESQDELTGLARALATTRSGADRNQTCSGEQLYERIEAELGDAAFIRVTEDMAELTRCNVIVSTSSSATPIIHAEHISSDPTVVCDIAVPPDVAPGVGKLRPLAKIITGGAVRLPNQPNLDLCAGHLPRGYVFACMAETMLLGLEAHAAHYSFGAIEIAQVHDIAQRAAKHGFEVGIVTDEDFDADATAVRIAEPTARTHGRAGDQ